MIIYNVGSVNPYLFPIAIILMAIAVASLAMWLVLRFRNKSGNSGDYAKYTVLLVVFMIAIAPGAVLLALHPTNSQIVVGNGYIDVSGRFIGSQNYTTAQIHSAFVGNINTGNLTIARKDSGGGGAGHISNEGIFTLSNGARADVITTNATALFIQLNSGTYLVLSPSNTSGFISSFSADVFAVAGIQ